MGFGGGRTGGGSPRMCESTLLRVVCDRIGAADERPAGREPDACCRGGELNSNTVLLTIGVLRLTALPPEAAATDGRDRRGISKLCCDKNSRSLKKAGNIVCSTIPQPTTYLLIKRCTGCT